MEARLHGAEPAPNGKNDVRVRRIRAKDDQFSPSVSGFNSLSRAKVNQRLLRSRSPAPSRSKNCLPRRLLAAVRSLVAPHPGQAHGKYRARFQAGLGADGAAVRAGDFTRDKQTQSDTGGVGRLVIVGNGQLYQGIENALQRSLRDLAAEILHLHHGRIGIAAGRDAHRLVVGPVLRGIVEQIGKQLGQTGRIEVADHLARGAQFEFALRVGGRGIFDGRLADFPQIAQAGRNGHAPPQLRPGKFQQVVHHGCHGRCAAGHPRTNLHRGSRARARPAQQRTGHRHRAQRTAQIVAEDGEKGIAGPVALLRIAYGRFLQRLVYRFIEAQDVLRRRFRRHRHLCHPQAQHAGPHCAKFRCQLRQREADLLAQRAMRGRCRFLARYFRHARGRFLFPLRRVLDDIHVAHDGLQHLLRMIA